MDFSTLMNTRNVIPCNMPIYKAFGLHISSELSIPELSAASDVTSDVHIRLGSIHAPDKIEDDYHIERRAGEILFYIPGIGGVRVL